MHSAPLPTHPPPSPCLSPPALPAGIPDLDSDHGPSVLCTGLCAAMIRWVLYLSPPALAACCRLLSGTGRPCRISWRSADVCCSSVTGLAALSPPHAPPDTEPGARPGWARPAGLSGRGGTAADNRPSDCAAFPLLALPAAAAAWRGGWEGAKAASACPSFP